MTFSNQTEKAAYKHIANAIKKYINPVEVTEDFIIFRDNEVKRNKLVDKYRKITRSDDQLKMDADCVLLEYHLITNQIVKPTSTWRNDFELFNMNIDAKRISSKWFNVSDMKLPQYLESMNSNHLTHFMFWKYNRKIDRPFAEGDTVSFTILDIVNAHTVIDSLKSSNRYGGYYYEVNRYEQAA